MDERVGNGILAHKVSEVSYLLKFILIFVISRICRFEIRCSYEL